MSELSKRHGLVFRSQINALFTLEELKNENTKKWEVTLVAHQFA